MFEVSASANGFPTERIGAPQAEIPLAAVLPEEHGFGS
jgi:hypothetical protein